MTQSHTAAISQTFDLGGDLRIGRVGFGAMRLSTNGFHGPARDAETGRKVLRKAVDLGINHIDTAAFYQSGDGSVRANTLIREALHPYGSELVIATKVGPVFEAEGPRPGRPDELQHLVEENLRSLAVERLDLVYLRIGMMEPPHGESLAERFAVLAQLQKEGKIRHLGLSNIDVDHLREAQAIASVAAVQNSFHIAKRAEVAVLEACETDNIAFAPFFPLGGGMTDIADERLKTVAERHGATTAQIGLAWLLHRSPVTLAIPGTGSLSHLGENTAARGITLSAEDLELLQ